MEEVDARFGSPEHSAGDYSPPPLPPLLGWQVHTIQPCRRPQSESRNCRTSVCNRHFGLDDHSNSCQPTLQQSKWSLTGFIKRSASTGSKQWLCCTRSTFRKALARPRVAHARVAAGRHYE